MKSVNVYWHEGMSLWPHHAQLSDRYNYEQLHRNSKLDLHYNWGLTSIKWNEDRIAESWFEVSELDARLPDGTLLSIPNDCRADALDLSQALESQSQITVLLALPQLNPGQANAVPLAARNDEIGANVQNRYFFEAQPVFDENTGDAAPQIEIRFPNCKLLTSAQDCTGYETLPIARFLKGADAEAPPQLDEHYIPPVLGCHVWPSLQTDFLQSIYDLLSARADALSHQVISQNITFQTRSKHAPMLVQLLHVLNDAIGLLNVLAFAEGVHPFWAYSELCRVVGKLAIFGEERRIPELPRYDHDDLYYCFSQIKKYIIALSAKVDIPTPDIRPFVGVETRLQVELEHEWLVSGREMYVGVDSTLGPEQCVRLLRRQAGSTGESLDMKIASAENVDRYYSLGYEGLRFSHVSSPPSILPSGLVWFQVDSEANQEEWNVVNDKRKLAIRLNNNLVKGKIPDEKIFLIKISEAETAEMSFTLYVVPEND